MKIPDKISDRIAELGMQVFDDQITRQDAAEDLAGKIRADDGIFLVAILTEWSRKKIHAWLIAKTRDFGVKGAAAGQQRLPFEDLPPQLEIGIGRTAHQNVMTGRDWDNALAIWKNRHIEAEASFRRFERCYNLIRPLLDDTDLTTADVIDQLPPDLQSDAL
jgi:hypothetical protein